LALALGGEFGVLKTSFFWGLVQGLVFFWALLGRGGGGGACLFSRFVLIMFVYYPSPI